MYKIYKNLNLRATTRHDQILLPRSDIRGLFTVDQEYIIYTLKTNIPISANLLLEPN